MNKINNDDEIILSDNILTPERFSILIEDLVWAEDISYIDAILKFQEEHEMDEFHIKDLLDENLKARIYREAVDMKQMKEHPTALDC